VPWHSPSPESPSLWRGGLAAALVLGASLGCTRTPSPLTPAVRGSVGTPSSGVLTEGRLVRSDAEGLRWLRNNDRHWGLPRFAEAIERAAARVARERPGAKLTVGDLSTPTGGGPIVPHFSHRSGMDADLLFYATTLEGVPVDSPGFVHFGADGLAHDDAHSRWLRFDVDREWLLVRALVEDRDARVQWIFVSDVVHALLVEWAIARGDPPETIERADEVMRQPHPGGIHDDHLHVRTTCSPEEVVEGCQPMGPQRAWLSYDLPSSGERDEDLALVLARPLSPAPVAQPSAAAGQTLANLPTKSGL
jgi:penicillin-insensitive murein endopeptidase